MKYIKKWRAAANTAREFCAESASARSSVGRSRGMTDTRARAIVVDIDFRETKSKHPPPPPGVLSEYNSCIIPYYMLGMKTVYHQYPPKCSYLIYKLYIARAQFVVSISDAI